MQNYIDILVEELKKGQDPLTVLAAFVAAWSTVDSSNILSTQIRRRLGLTYMGDIKQAISTLISRISSDPNFGKKAIDVLALAIERDWVRNALKEAAWKGVAQQLKQAAEALYNTHRSYSTKIFLEDITKIVESQQVRSMFDYGSTQQGYGYPQPPPYPPQTPIQQYPRYPQTQYPYSAPSPANYPQQQAQKPSAPPPTPQQPKVHVTQPPSTVQQTPSSTPQEPKTVQPTPKAPVPAQQPTEKTSNHKVGISSDDLNLFKEEISRYLDTIQVRFSQLSDEIKKLRTDISPLLELNKMIQDISNQIKELSTSINNVMSKYDELKKIIDLTNTQFSRSIEELKSKINTLSSEIEKLKSLSVSEVPRIETHEEVAEEIKETVNELFELIEAETEVETPKPTSFEKMVTARMEEYYRKEVKVGEIKVPPYVFIIAIGNIGKLRELLSGDEVPGYMGRWSFQIVESGKKSQVFIQALHKEISNTVLNESLSLGDGVLVLTPIRNIAALNNALSSLSRRMKKCKFVIIDSDSKPRGLKVPGNFKVITKKIDNKEQLLEIIKSEIFPLF